MNQDERRIITEYVERVSGAVPAPGAAGAGGSSGGPWGGSVPATQARPSLPPVDREADSLIADLFNRHPEARYRITQTAFVQEAALVEAQNRIRRLEWEVENAKRQAQQAEGQRGGGGLFGGMFGGGGNQNRRPAAPMPPPPQPVYPPGYNPAMLQQQQGRSGSGFLGTALTTAAGVAGGMVLGNMLMNAFSGSHGAASAATPVADAGAAAAGGDAVPAASPWTDPGAAAASQGWGEDGGQKDGFGEQDKFAGADQGGGEWGNQDASPAGYDDAGSFDDGGGYDEEV